MEKLEGTCNFDTLDFPPEFVVHHSGGLRLVRPGGTRNRIPLETPVFESLTGSPSFLFRDGRDTRRRIGEGGQVLRSPGFFADVTERAGGYRLRLGKDSVLRMSGLNARLRTNSWANLLESSAKPSITSGLFATFELNLRIPPPADKQLWYVRPKLHAAPTAADALVRKGTVATRVATRQAA